MRVFKNSRKGEIVFNILKFVSTFFAMFGFGVYAEESIGDQDGSNLEEDEKEYEGRLKEFVNPFLILLYSKVLLIVVMFFAYAIYTYGFSPPGARAMDSVMLN